MAAPSAPGTGEAAEAAARAVSRRYEALVSVRSKAMKGKGAWYWAHLEPLLIHGPDSGLPKAVKLRCCLCDAVFSASNPSRTSSEHLKRGTCPNFTSAAAAAAGPSSAPRPISSLPPSRKRPSLPSTSAPEPSPSLSCLALVDPSAAAGNYPAFSSSSSPPSLPPPTTVVAAPHHPLVLSGGKEDLDALAMLQDSVQRLKCPKASPGPALSKPQADAALFLFAEWLLDTGIAASPSSLDHPKLRAFLLQLGLPNLSPRHVFGPMLDHHYRIARSESISRTRDALFFQLDSAGWNSDHGLISIAVNLPYGTTVLHRSIVASSRATSDYAEDILRVAIDSVSEGGSTHRCAGIVADRFKSKALRSIEAQNQWMVNVPCQRRGFHCLIQDFASGLPLFHSAASNCSRIAAFFNSHSVGRALLHKYQLQELNHSHLLHYPSSFDPARNFLNVFPMLEDVMGCSHFLQLAIIDEEYKLLCLEDPAARELADMIRDMRFWNELEAVRSLVKLVETMTNEMEAERPLLGQCLQLWDELRNRVKDWRTKFVLEGTVDEIVERRFKKNYHPAWSAAFILDPLYLSKDASGKYLPPFKFLTPEQEKDVDRLITRLVSREEAHIVLMELMKWRTEGLDPLYAQAVQVKQPDPTTGKMRLANPQSSRLVWETCLGELPSLGRVAVRLIFLHATACRVHCSPLMLACARRSRAAAQRVEKMVFVAAHSRFKRRIFVDEDEKDVEILAEDDEASASVEASSM